MQFPYGMPNTAYSPPGETQAIGTSLNALLPGANPSLALGESDTPFFTFQIDLSVNRSIVPLQISYDGDFIEFNDSTNATDKIQIAYNNQLVDTKSGAFRNFYRGSTFSGPRFKQLFIYHPAIAASTAVLLVARQFARSNALQAQT